MRIERPLVTVFTATYNRAHTIHRTWDSLCSQTYKHFEWIVIDDESNDGTVEIMEKYAREATFPMQYIRCPRQKNSGKNVAWNKCMKIAKGELTIVLDSDDACTPDAIQTFVEAWQSLGERAGEFAYVAVLCHDQHGVTRGTKFPKDRMESDHLEIHWKYRVRGDKWECYRTDVLKQYPLPELDRRSGMPEGIILARMSKKYKVLYLNKFLRTYFNDGVGASLVNVPDPRGNAWGKFINDSEAIWAYPHWHLRAPWEFVLLALRLNRNIQLLRLSRSLVRRYLPTARSRVIVALFELPGRFLGAWERVFKFNASGRISL